MKTTAVLIFCALFIQQQLLTLVFARGYVNQEVTVSDIKWSIVKCIQNGSIKSISVDKYEITAVCKNTALFTIDRDTNKEN